jgi:hypothetical protein
MSSRIIKEDETVFPFDAVTDKIPFVKKYYLIRKKSDVLYLDSLKKERDDAYEIFIHGTNESDQYQKQQENWNQKYHTFLQSQIALAGNKYIDEDIGYQQFYEWSLKNSRGKYERDVLKKIEEQRSLYEPRKLSLQEKLDRAREIYEAENYKKNH